MVLRLVAYRFVLLSLLTLRCHGFSQIIMSSAKGTVSPQFSSSSHHDNKEIAVVERRDLLKKLSAVTAFVLPTTLLMDTDAATAATDTAAVVMKDDPSAMFAPKFVQQYEDFIVTPEGWSYRDVKPGNSNNANAKAELNDRVVFDWSGYTIGYFGRPFQAKGGPQGVSNEGVVS
jgi:hypothetical protein